MAETGRIRYNIWLKLVIKVVLKSAKLFFSRDKTGKAAWAMLSPINETGAKKESEEKRLKEIEEKIKKLESEFGEIKKVEE